MSIDAIEQLRAQRAELEKLYRTIRSSIETDDIQHDIIQKYKLDPSTIKNPTLDRRFSPAGGSADPPLSGAERPSAPLGHDRYYPDPSTGRGPIPAGYTRRASPSPYGFPSPDGYRTTERDGPPPAERDSFWPPPSERRGGHRPPEGYGYSTDGYADDRIPADRDDFRYPADSMPSRPVDPEPSSRATDRRFAGLSPEYRAFTDAYTRLSETERKAEEDMQHLDLVFLVDCTASMTPTIRTVAAKLVDILNALSTTFSHVNSRVAFVGYRDVGCRQPFIIHDFNTPDTMRARIALVDVEGNADDAEDVLGGYAETLKLSWAPGAHRILLHFLDNPPHGRRFHTGRISDRYLDSEPPAPHKPSSWLEECVRLLCEKRIYVCMFAVSGYADQVLRKTVEEFGKAFSHVPYSKGKLKFTSTKLETGDDDVTNEFFQKVLDQVTASMIASGAKRRTG